jgi:signal transduction histidine kinase
MSRLTRLWSRFFLNASTLRTYLETILVFIAFASLTALIFQRSLDGMTFSSLLFFINPITSLYYSLRLRIPGGRWYQTLGLDLLQILIPTLILNPLLWLATRTFLIDMLGYSNDLRSIDTLFIALLAFPYLFFRVGLRFLVWWNALRQRRVIWSLVTSNLAAVALLQALIVLPLAVVFFLSDWSNIAFVDLPNTIFAQFLYRLQALLPLVGVAMLVATVVLIALLPVSIGVSYFFARRIRQRLEVLLTAAHAARDGNYDTQIVVSGQDEIARLQADFNVMTANLKINIDELRDEREKVATLLKTRRELMANVSHELRTPIATVRAYLESALRQQQTGIASDGQLTLSENDLAIIQQETLRLQTLIDDLFALSRAEVDQLALKSEPMDVIPLLQRVVDTVAPLAWRVNRIEIVAKLPTWLPQIVADESRLEQVLRNLIHNSLRHTPPGGLVIISAEMTDGYAQLQVQDTGEGIQPEQLSHIWERYYRDAENGGTGLGLALVKSFVEAMHGTVTAASALGEGACFTLRLPLAETSLDDALPPLPRPQPVLRPSTSLTPSTNSLSTTPR